MHDQRPTHVRNDLQRNDQLYRGEGIVMEFSMAIQRPLYWIHVVVNKFGIVVILYGTHPKQKGDSGGGAGWDKPAEYLVSQRSIECDMGL
jgi:hypothetical protein